MVPYILVIKVSLKFQLYVFYLFIYLSALHVSGYAHLQELQMYFANQRCVYSVDNKMNIIRLCGAMWVYGYVFLGLLWCGWCLCRLDLLWWCVVFLDVMCLFYILYLQFWCVIPLDQVLVWDTLALSSQSDLNWCGQSTFEAPEDGRSLKHVEPTNK